MFDFKINFTILFFIILFGINEPNKLWKKKFKTIHHLSYFVGHLVDCRPLCSGHTITIFKP